MPLPALCSCAVPLISPPWPLLKCLSLPCRIVSSTGALLLKEVPKKMVVIGGSADVLPEQCLNRACAASTPAPSRSQPRSAALRRCNCIHTLSKPWGPFELPSAEQGLQCTSPAALWRQVRLLGAFTPAEPLSGWALPPATLFVSGQSVLQCHAFMAVHVSPGGYIGLEMGSVWQRLGAEVTVVEFLDTIVPTMVSSLSPGGLCGSLCHNRQLQVQAVF